MFLKIRAMVPIAAIMCVCMLAVVPAAMAHEFEASQAKGIVQDKGGKQVFESAATPIECEAEESQGKVQTKKSETSKEAVEYKGCKAFGASAEVSQAKYEFNANGTVTLENEVTVKAAGPKCEAKIPGGGSNSNLGTVTYTNNGSGDIQVKANITGITSTLGGSGGLCPKATNKTGKYIGESTVEFFDCQLVTKGKYKDSLCENKSEAGTWERVPGEIKFV